MSTPAVTSAKNIWQRAHQMWTLDLWEPERASPQAPLSTRLLTIAGRSAYIVVSGLWGERIRLRAAALTYVTLLSLVPAIAVGFALIGAFGGFSDTRSAVKEFMVDALAVSHRETVLEYLDQFVSQASAPQLGTIGTVFLLITVISLLTNIEEAFNDIWGVTKGRSILQRFTVYWPLVTLAPILLGVSLSLTTAVRTSYTVQQLTETAPAFGLFTNLGPYVLTILFFTMVYKIMPNTAVRWRFAVVGGVFGGTLWVAAQKLYALYASNAITYSAIYGSLGAVPLFVIWIYVSWMVALLGATLVFAVQSARTYAPERAVSAHERDLVATRLMLAVAQHFGCDEGAIGAQRLVDDVPFPPRLTRRVLGELVQRNLLVETTLEEADDIGYLPSRPTAHITLADVLRVMRRGGSEDVEAGADPLGAQAKALLDAAEAVVDERLASLTLADLVKTEELPAEDVE